MFDLFFDKDFYKFNRLTRDMSPYQIKRFEDHMVVVHNVIGIDENDLNIELVPEKNITYLEIKGETKNEILNTTYSVNSRFSINKDEIKDITYNIKNGLLYLNINYKKPEKVDIKITKE